jgi:hypothetical protein
MDSLQFDASYWQERLGDLSKAVEAIEREVKVKSFLPIIPKKEISATGTSQISPWYTLLAPNSSC